MIAAFRSGEDIHTVTASQVFGVPPEAVTHEMRRRAKAVNFGIVYGISDFSLSQDIGVTRAEAREYMEKYFEKYSGVHAMPIQGTAADIIKLAMIKVRDKLLSEGLEARLVLQVHDELIVECPEGETERVKALLEGEMEHVVELALPLTAEAHAGRSWAEAKG